MCSSYTYVISLLFNYTISLLKQQTPHRKVIYKNY
jgi:hypothetical protein